jgi:hypothetical protein
MHFSVCFTRWFGMVLAALSFAEHAQKAAPDVHELAIALANPIARRVQVAIQQNFDLGFGLDSRS